MGCWAEHGLGRASRLTCFVLSKRRLCNLLLLASLCMLGSRDRGGSVLACVRERAAAEEALTQAALAQAQAPLKATAAAAQQFKK